MIANIARLDKKELSEFMGAIRQICLKSAREIAIETDYSVTMVNNVFQGVNNNQTIIKSIMDNMPVGWEEFIPVKFYKVLDNEVV